MPDEVPVEPAPSTRRRVPVAVVASILLVVGVVGLATAAWVVKRLQTRSSNRSLQQAAQAAQQGRYDEAFTLLAAACDAQPDVPDFAKRAALAALAAGRIPEAASYARRAWEAGVRDEEVLGALLAGESSAGSDLSRAEALISALPDQAARLRLRARVLVAHGRLEEARQALHELVELEPSPVAVAALAEVLMREGKGRDAHALLQTHRAAGRLDVDGYRLLALAQVEQDLAQPDPSRRGAVLDIIAEARAAGLVNDALRLDQATFQITHLDLRGALATLGEIGPGRLDVEARLLEALALATLGRAGEWQPPAPGRIGGAAGEALRLLAQALAGTDPADGIFSLQKAERLIGERPVLHLLIGRLMAARGERDAALERYRLVRGHLAYAPMVLLEQAEIQAMQGRRDAAVGLVLAVHRLHGPTRRSLLLFDALAGGMVGADVIDAMRRVAAAQTSDRQMVELADDLARRRLAISSPAEQSLAPEERAIADAVRARLVRREFEPALTELAASRLPDPVRESLRGFALQGLGRHADAVAAFTAARSTQQPASLHLSEALSSLALRDGAAAVAAAARARETMPADAMVWQVQVSAWIQSGRADDALAQLESPAAAAIEPVQRDALRAMVFASLGRAAEALAAAQASLAIQPRHPVALPLALDALLASGRSDEALALMAGIDPGEDPTLLIRRLAIHLARADHRAALADLDQVPADLRAAIDAEALRIRLLCVLGDAKEAQRALGLLPADFPAHRRAVLSALIQEQAGRRPAAVYMLRDHLSDPEAAFLWARLALAEDPQVAVAAALRSAGLPGETLRRIAGLIAAAERWEEAARVATLARERTPRDPLVLNDWAWYTAQAGAPLEQPVAAAREACALLPGHPVPLETAAELLVRAGSAAEAVRLLAGHRATVDRTPALQLVEARAHAKAGDSAQAAVLYDRLLQALPAGPTWTLPASRDQVVAERAALTP